MLQTSEFATGTKEIYFITIKEGQMYFKISKCLMLLNLVVLCLAEGFLLCYKDVLQSGNGHSTQD
jgi:hypothetical protein